MADHTVESIEQTLLNSMLRVTVADVPHIVGWDEDLTGIYSWDIRNEGKFGVFRGEDEADAAPNVLAWINAAASPRSSEDVR